ncbi:hypothetical protein BH11PLA1_BH11PLA1_06340 [soil metagenome]
MATPLNPDLKRQYAAENSRTLRERFIWMCGLIAAFTLIFSLRRGWDDLFIPLLMWLRHAPIDWHFGKVFAGIPGLLVVAVFGIVGWRAWIGRLKQNDLMHLARTMIQACGAVAIVLYPIYDLQRMLPLEAVFVMHVIAASCLPWTLRDAVRPMLPLVALNAVMILVSTLWNGASVSALVEAGLLSLVSPIVLVPGAAIAAVKDRWQSELFRTRFFESQYGRISRELVDARSLHEALFPKVETRNGIRLDYRYAPMSHIGGDFLFARFHENAAGEAAGISAVLLDVTGHGVSAALTVNRLAGELERVFAEDERATPADVLSALNRYVLLTLAPHAIYCTAMAVRVEGARGAKLSDADEGAAPNASGEAAASAMLTLASAGHPPAFIRRAAGDGLERFDATAPMLGVLETEKFAPTEAARELHAGDHFIGITDGAIEARGADGTFFGPERVAAALLRASLGDGATLPGAVVAAVDAFRSGAMTDDIVVLDLSFEPAVSATLAGWTGSPSP